MESKMDHRDSGRASRSAIQGVIRDISQYIEIVSEELRMLEREAEELHAVWADGQYENFMNEVQRMRSSLDRELDALERPRLELEKKVGMM